MTPVEFHDGRVVLYRGDCLEVLDSLPENSIDACVCDPPYHLQSIVKRFAKTGRLDSTRTASGPHQRTVNGFMNKVWDGGDIAFRVETWAKVLRVLKPGAYIVAFSSSRTFGRMSVALEDAGFITHPMIGWIFGQGFPKAHNAARAVDKHLGKTGSKTPIGEPVRRIRPGADQNADGTWEKLEDREYQPGSYEPATEEARAWQGFAYGGQSLKPALEPIYCGQKPYSEANGAANLLRWGVGAMNIDGCRIPTDDSLNGGAYAEVGGRSQSQSLGASGMNAPGKTVGSPFVQPMGRWPANVCTDGSLEVLAEFPDSNGQNGVVDGQTSGNEVYGKRGPRPRAVPRADAGSAARFFASFPQQNEPHCALFRYDSKAGQDDRIGSAHPTVKPVDLMRWLVRLVTPPGGTVLDCFAGSGTTAEAAFHEGFKSILIEREAAYCVDIERRMALMLRSTDHRRRESVKAKGKTESAGPLFEGP